MILSTDDKIKAKAYLLNLWESINQRRELNTNNLDQVESMTGPLDKFESAMRELDKSVPLSMFVDQKRIDHLLDDFETIPRLNSSENVLEWLFK